MLTMYRIGIDDDIEPDEALEVVVAAFALSVNRDGRRIVPGTVEVLDMIEHDYLPEIEFVLIGMVS